MPRTPINLHHKVREILEHLGPLPVEAGRPFAHFEKSVNDDLALIKYIEDHVDSMNIYGAVYDRHIGHLTRMVLAEILESFERFIKELASGCVDFLVPFAADDRFDEFLPKGSDHIAAFVNANSIGRVLCEQDTWLNNASINKRFRSLLKDHFGKEWEFLFPDPKQEPVAERQRAATLRILWQIRHTLAHNVGVITHSDSMKFRMLISKAVVANQRIVPRIDDLKYVRRFLIESARNTNKRVGERLAALLETFHSSDNSLFDPQAKANEVARFFEFPCIIQGCVGVV